MKRRLRRTAAGETPQILFQETLMTALEDNNLDYTTQGNDIVAINPNLVKYASAWEETIDTLVYDHDLQVPSEFSPFVTFSEAGDVLVHCVVPAETPRFFFNRAEYMLEGSMSPELLVNTLKTQGIDLDNLFQNLYESMLFLVKFNLGGEELSVVDLERLVDQDLGDVEVNEHEELPEDLAEQEIFNATMNTMINDYNYNQRLTQLKQQIDEALDNGDRELFQQLSEEYNRLLNQRAQRGRRLLKKAFRLS